MQMCCRANIAWGLLSWQCYEKEKQSQQRNGCHFIEQGGRGGGKSSKTAWGLQVEKRLWDPSSPCCIRSFPLCGRGALRKDAMKQCCVLSLCSAMTIFILQMRKLRLSYVRSSLTKQPSLKTGEPSLSLNLTSGQLFLNTQCGCHQPVSCWLSNCQLVYLPGYWNIK